MKITNSLLYKEYINRENDIEHAPYNPELNFYNSIKSGDIKKVMYYCSESLAEKPGLGTLSDNPLQNLKYHFVISVAMITRYCIEGGMDFSSAYTLSDYYILTGDNCRSIEEISKLHATMSMDYANRMNSLHHVKLYTKHISDSIDYIYNHLHTRITVAILADHVGLSPAYLSRLFKAETGMPVNEYIRYKKLETAKSMLAYSDYSVSNISSILAFPSHSYFTEIFRKAFKLTPTQYRSENYKRLNL